jgi:hypothetical protein
VAQNPKSTTEWLTIPDLVDLLGIPVSRVRRLIEDNHLAASRIDGVLKVPASFLVEGEPLPELHGTIVLLHDCGFEGNEVVEWLTLEEMSLGVAPIDALKAGRKAEVRRIAQALL